MKILHIIPRLDYNSAAAQLGLLTQHLPDACDSHICCLGESGPWAVRLREQGRRVDCLHWSRVFDPAPLWKLHRLLNTETPDVIHAWGLAALRSLAFVGRRWLRRTIASQTMPGIRTDLGRIDRWLLRRVQMVAATSQAEATWLQANGLAPSNIAVMAPGVEIPSTSTPPRNQESDSFAGRILCIGALERHYGFRDAIWAFDILRYITQESRLLIAGAGPQRAYLEWFAASLQMEKSVDFLGERADVVQLLNDADICWSPSGAASNQQVVLEAMAAGRPVIAADRPGLRELIDDGVTGFIVPPGDKVALCKHTRSLLLDPSLADRIGAAARDHVARHLGAAACAQHWARQYSAAA